MNLLAHFFLSGTKNHPLTVGNFMGDFVKGKKYMSYPPEIRKGILLHRAIDSYTDHHPVVIQSKRRLYSRYHHYSAVLIDIYYDHILASGFSKYSAQALPEFTREVYTLLSRHKEWLPERAGNMLPYMIRDNWLWNYSKMDQIGRVIKNIASRSPNAGSMATGLEELEHHFPLFEEEFKLFWPDMQQHVREWLENYKI